MTAKVAGPTYPAKPMQAPTPLEASRHFSPRPLDTFQEPFATPKERKAPPATKSTGSSPTPPMLPEAKSADDSLNRLYNDSRMVTFVDESHQEGTDGAYYYVLGYVSIESNCLASLRREADNEFKEGWFHANGKDKYRKYVGKPKRLAENTKMVSLIQKAAKEGNIKIGSIVYRAPCVDPTQGMKVIDSAARKECLKRLVNLKKGGTIVFEEADGHNDKEGCRCDNCADKSLLKRFNQEQDAPNKIRHRHISPKDEHLLWFPDAIAHLTFRYMGRKQDKELYETFGKYCQAAQIN